MSSSHPDISISSPVARLLMLSLLMSSMNPWQLLPTSVAFGRKKEMHSRKSSPFMNCCLLKGRVISVFSFHRGCDGSLHIVLLCHGCSIAQIPHFGWGYRKRWIALWLLLLSVVWGCQVSTQQQLSFSNTKIIETGFNMVIHPKLHPYITVLESEARESRKWNQGAKSWSLSLFSWMQLKQQHP